MFKIAKWPYFALGGQVWLQSDFFRKSPPPGDIKGAWGICPPPSQRLCPLRRKNCKNQPFSAFFLFLPPQNRILPPRCPHKTFCCRHSPSPEGDQKLRAPSIKNLEKENSGL